jgi:hypothetical protein
LNREGLQKAMRALVYTAVFLAGWLFNYAAAVDVTIHKTTSYLAQGWADSYYAVASRLAR